ncbi:hypothetical protein DRW07_01935 [Alteromonas sediminis]|uniref:DUF1700 domain-containing protein n=1 Tax=Alteromonas sediminis TaxID=2259342 RepID=A0A3N5Y4T1_9ALTE|nr:hypothetical protein [Alteromonas sediminis]RPJ68193.1 hypothetical protein DRW07_01935 [Alteromonas sediminis]
MSRLSDSQEREKIHSYLKTLGKYLSRLEVYESEEVLREIESHIFDAIDLKEVKGEPVDIDSILSGFGPPRQLAEQYVSHILHGTPPPPGFSALEVVKRGASKGLYWATAGFGYGVGAALILLAFAKLLAPQHVGVWSSANGNSIVIAIVNNPLQQGEDVLGMWLVPVAVIAGFLILRLTYSILRVFRGA